MKKYFAFILAVILLGSSLSACGSGPVQSAAKDDRLQIVTTIFPEYDWVRNILGDNPANAEVTLLLDNGVDLHSYQATADDILKIATCDLFIYVGGASDEWVEAALREAENEEMVVINLLDILGEKAKEEELVEGMEDEEEHGHEHDEAEEEVVYDEHVWLSLRNASVLVDRISETLQAMDADNAAAYRSNTETYKEKLNDLDGKYQETISAAPVTTLLFGDRFPFRYLVDDYGLSYYAAFSGCSAETEASFETITFLAQKADELSLQSIIQIEGTGHRIAETVVENTQWKQQQILRLDSMQSITAKDVQNGTTYLSIMEKNLEVLKEALQ